MSTAHINIGSNLGDRHALIGQAVAAIERALHATARCSRAFESSPWGYESPNKFLNVGIAIDTVNISPVHLLHILQEIEHDINPAPHRDLSGKYVDRSIDIDLIAVDTLTLSTPELILPHPRMHLREFVLIPMQETAPTWRHPVTGLTPAAMLRLLPQPTS